MVGTGACDWPDGRDGLGLIAICAETCLHNKQRNQRTSYLGDDEKGHIAWRNA